MNLIKIWNDKSSIVINNRLQDLDYMIVAQRKDLDPHVYNMKLEANIALHVDINLIRSTGRLAYIP